MQDGKALQSGTSHYLGTNFASAQNIRYQNESGSMTLCHTTSWGLSTRVIGGVIMTHGDDDGLRLPPAIAPRQIVLVPMLRGDDKDGAILDYCDAIAGSLNEATAFRLPLRAYVDKKQVPSAEKRWNWVRRGVPLILEIGQRDVTSSNVTFMPRRAAQRREVRFARRAERHLHCPRPRPARRHPVRALRRGQATAHRQHPARLRALRTGGRLFRRRRRGRRKPFRLQGLGAGALVQADRRRAQ